MSEAQPHPPHPPPPPPGSPGEGRQRAKHGRAKDKGRREEHGRGPAAAREGWEAQAECPAQRRPSSDSETQRRLSGALDELAAELERARHDRDRVTQLLFNAVRLAQKADRLPVFTPGAPPPAGGANTAAQLLQVLGVDEVLRSQREVCRRAQGLLEDARDEIQRLQGERDAARREAAELREQLERSKPLVMPTPTLAPTRPVVQPLDAVRLRVSGSSLPMTNSYTVAGSTAPSDLPARAPAAQDALAAVDTQQVGVSFGVSSEPQADYRYCESENADEDSIHLGVHPGMGTQHWSSGLSSDRRSSNTCKSPAGLEPGNAQLGAAAARSSVTVLQRRRSSLKQRGSPAAPTKRVQYADQQGDQPQSRGQLLSITGDTGEAGPPAPPQSQDDYVFHYRRRLPWFVPASAHKQWAPGEGTRDDDWGWAGRHVPANFSMYALARTATVSAGAAQYGGEDAEQQKRLGRAAGAILEERPFFERQEWVQLMLLVSVIVEFVDSALDLRTCGEYYASDKRVIAYLIALVLVVSGILRGLLNLHIERKSIQQSTERLSPSHICYLLCGFLPIPVVDLWDGWRSYRLVCKLDTASFLVMEPVRAGRQQLRAVLRALCEAVPQLLVQVYAYQSFGHVASTNNRRLLMASMIISGLSILKAVLMYVRQATGADSRGALLDEYNLTDPVQKKALLDRSPLQFLQSMTPRHFTTFMNFIAGADFGYVRLDDLMLLLNSAGEILHRMKGSAERGRLRWPAGKSLLIMNCLIPLDEVLQNAYKEVFLKDTRREAYAEDMTCTRTDSHCADDQRCTTALATALAQKMLDDPDLLVDRRFDVGLTVQRLVCGTKVPSKAKPGMVFAGGVAGGQALRGDGAMVLAALIAGQRELRWLDASGNALSADFSPHEQFAAEQRRKQSGGGADWIWASAAPQEGQHLPRRNSGGSYRRQNSLCSFGRRITNADFESDEERKPSALGCDVVFAAILQSSSRGAEHQCVQDAHDGLLRMPESSGHKLTHVDLRANNLHNEQLWTAARLSLAMCFRSLPPGSIMPRESSVDSIAFDNLRSIFLAGEQGGHECTSDPATWPKLRPIHIIVRGGNGTPEVSGVDLDRIDVVVQAVIDMFHHEFGTKLVPPEDPEAYAAPTPDEEPGARPRDHRRDVHGPCTLDEDDLVAMTALLRDFVCLRALRAEVENVVSEVYFLDKVLIKPEVWQKICKTDTSIHVFRNMLMCQYAGLQLHFASERCVTRWVSKLLEAAAQVSEPRRNLRAVEVSSEVLQETQRWSERSGVVKLEKIEPSMDEANGEQSVTDPASEAAELKKLEHFVGKQLVSIGTDLRRPAVDSLLCLQMAPEGRVQVYFCDPEFKDSPPPSPSARRLTSFAKKRRPTSAPVPAAAEAQEDGPRRKTRRVEPADPEAAQVLLRCVIQLWQFGRTNVPFALPDTANPLVTAYLDVVKRMMAAHDTVDDSEIVRKACRVFIHGDHGKIKISVADLSYVVECAQGVRAFQLQNAMDQGPDSSLDLDTGGDLHAHTDFGRRASQCCGTEGARAKEMLQAGGPCGGEFKFGLEQLCISGCVLDDGHVEVIAELMGCCASQCEVSLPHDGLQPRHLQTLMKRVSKDGFLSLDISGNDHLIRQSATTSRVLLNLRNVYANVHIKWEDWSAGEVAGTQPYRLADGLLEARSSCTCETARDYEPPSLPDEKRDKSQKGIQVIQGMEEWYFKEARERNSKSQAAEPEYPFASGQWIGEGHTVIADLVHDIEAMHSIEGAVAENGIEKQTSILNPLFAYTAELHYKYLWAVWECNWQPDASTSAEPSRRRTKPGVDGWFTKTVAGHWVLLPEEAACEAEHAYQNMQGNKLNLREDGEHHATAFNELGDPVFQRVELTEGGAEGFAAEKNKSNPDSCATLIHLVRYENRWRNDPCKSPFHDTVLWAPALCTKGFGDWKWLPPSGVLEFIASRPPGLSMFVRQDAEWHVAPARNAEIVKEWFEKTQPHSSLRELSLDPNMREGQDAEAELEPVVIAARTPQLLTWGGRRFLLALDRAKGLIMELGSQKNFTELYRVAHPLHIQPCAIINTALRFAQFGNAARSSSNKPGHPEQRSESPSPRRRRSMAPNARRSVRESIALEHQEVLHIERARWQASLTLGGEGTEMSEVDAKSFLHQVTPMVLLLNEALRAIPLSTRPKCLYRCVPKVPTDFEDFERRLYKRDHLVLWAGFSSATERDLLQAETAVRSVNFQIVYEAKGSVPSRSKALNARDISKYSRQARLREWLYPACTAFKVEEERGEGDQTTTLLLNELSSMDVHVYLVHGLLPQASTNSAAGIVFAVQQAVRGDHVLQLSLDDEVLGHAVQARWEEQLSDMFGTMPAELVNYHEGQWQDVKEDAQEYAQKLYKIRSGLPATDDRESDDAQHLYSAVTAQGKEGWTSNVLGPLKRSKQESGPAVLELICRVLGLGLAVELRPNVCWIHAPTTAQAENKVESMQVRLAHWSKWGVTLKLRKGRGREGLAIGQEGMDILVSALTKGVNLQQIGLVNHAVSTDGATKLLDAVRVNKHVQEVSLDKHSSRKVRAALALRCLYNRSLLGVPIKAQQIFDACKEMKKDSKGPANHGDVDDDESCTWQEALAFALHDVPDLRLPMYDILVTLTKGREHEAQKMKIWEDAWESLQEAFRKEQQRKGGSQCVPKCHKSDLHSAARGNELWTFRVLLQTAGRSDREALEAPDNTGLVPLHIVARNPYIGISRRKSRRGASAGSIDEPLRELLGDPDHDLLKVPTTGDGATPLHLAAAAGQTETVAGLLALGADPKIDDKQGEVPLHLAAARAEFDNRGCSDVLRQLANLPDPYSDYFPRARTGTGVGSAAGDKDFVLNKRDKSGRTPLHVAASYARSTICQILLDLGAEVDARTTEAEGSLTPLMCALRHANPHALLVLSEKSTAKLPERMRVLGAQPQGRMSGPPEPQKSLPLPRPELPDKMWKEMKLHSCLLCPRDVSPCKVNLPGEREGKVVEPELQTWPVGDEDENGYKETTRRLREELDMIYGERGGRNLVQCYGCACHEGVLIIAFEYLELSLEDLIKQQRSQSGHQMQSMFVRSDGPKALRSLAWQILCGLAYLQRRLVIHRDIKPLNVMLAAAEGVVKLRNVGLSAGFPPEAGQTDAWNDSHTFTGTLKYMPPERCRGEKYSYSADTWAVGIVINQMGLGTHPFDGVAPIFKILEGNVPQMPAVFGDHCRSFVEMCLRKETQNRPDSLALLRHRWFAGCDGAQCRQRLQEWLSRQCGGQAAGGQPVPAAAENDTSDTEQVVDTEPQKQKLLALACVRVKGAAEVEAACQTTPGARLPERLDSWEHKSCFGLRCWAMELIKVIPADASYSAGHVGMGSPGSRAYAETPTSPDLEHRHDPDLEQYPDTDGKLDTVWLPRTAVIQDAVRRSPQARGARQ